MSLDLTPEQKATGKANFEQATGDLARGGKMKSMAVGGPATPADPKDPDRRDFLKAGLAAGAVVPVSAAVYYGYQSWQGGNPVRTALIGCGDEGGVLIGDHNREFNKFVAVCDIRPSNRKRIFEGEPQGPRKGLKKIYGDDAEKEIKAFNTVEELLAAKDALKLEAVVIATPLNTHDVIVKKCLDAGLHVLCEKLMARTITKCKEMVTYARDKGLLLAVGHQRHYSTLYAQALELLESGVLGDIKFIRALWHRNNSWPYDQAAFNDEKYDRASGVPYYVDSWWKEVLNEDAKALDPKTLGSPAVAFGNPAEYGFDNIAELVRWRCYDKTGGGLMAELGSHQLDASSIILGHVRPLAVTGVGGKFFYGPGRNDRESYDTVSCTFEFPGPKHPKAAKPGTDPKLLDENDVVLVTYSSINTNEFEGYGEWVMGTEGTMFIEKEADVYLFREKTKGKSGDKTNGGRDTKVVVTGAGGGKPAMEATSSWGGGGGAAISKAPGSSAWDAAVRGYRTEMEHFAFCVREWQKRKQPVSYEKAPDGHLKYADIIPRCHGEVAMADAILALTANMAMATRQRIAFEDAWFDFTKPDVPETKYGKKPAGPA